MVDMPEGWESAVPDLGEAMAAAKNSKDPLVHFLPLLTTSFLLLIPGVAQAVMDYEARIGWDPEEGRTFRPEEIDEELVGMATGYVVHMLVDVAERAEGNEEQDSRIDWLS